MNRTQARFKKADVKRAVEAILALGLSVASVKIAPDGSIDIITAEPTKTPATDLDRWILTHADQA